MTPEIRALGPDDWALWREIRLEALRDYPANFLTTHGEELARSEAETRARLAQGRIRAAFDGADLAGVLALIPHERAATRHRASVGAFYVRPRWQGSGIADALMEAAAAEAGAAGIRQLELSVAEDNARAIRFYERHGFVRCGREPRVVWLGNRYQDDLFYVRILSDAPPGEG